LVVKNHGREPKKNRGITSRGRAPVLKKDRLEGGEAGSWETRWEGGLKGRCLGGKGTTFFPKEAWRSRHKPKQIPESSDVWYKKNFPMAHNGGGKGGGDPGEKKKGEGVSTIGSFAHRGKESSHGSLLGPQGGG